MTKLAFGAGVLGVTLALGGLSTGCGSRSEEWSAPVESAEPTGLSGAVALLDKELDRVVFVTSPRDAEDRKVDDRTIVGTPEVALSAEPVGKNVQRTLASEDGTRFFVLSQGDSPRVNPEDERPQLLVFDGTAKIQEKRLIKSFALDDPLGQLALDPEGEWVAAYESVGTVTNPNELVLLSLGGSEVEGKAESKTIRSFGGAPEELIFTEELTMPEGGARRFLIVRTDRDVTLVDLSDLERPEVTVPLTENEEEQPFEPVQIVYDDGDAEDPTDARLAVRLNGTSDVVMLRFDSPDKPDRDFRIVPNIVDVGGVASAIDFVRTDGGLRLAALVPGRGRATLVDPDTTLAQSVDLGPSFSQMRRITDLVADAPQAGDVALLWGAGNQIGFWSLGTASENPFRSIDVTSLDIQVDSVRDVPAPNQHLKVLTNRNASKFFVLDLQKRQSFPLNTVTGGYEVKVAPDGERLWAASRGQNDFSQIVLEDLHPVSLFVEPSVDFVFDIAQGEGDRAALVLHLRNGWAVTTMDARQPSSSETSYFPALHLEGIK